jgi:uncharacterized LabA/DUF88 family protein
MASKSRLLVFVDEANVTRAASKNFNKNFDWLRFRDYITNYGETPRELVEMVVYVGLPPNLPEWMEKRDSKLHYVHWLKSQGFLVYEKNGQPRPNWFKANVDVIMAIDAIDLSLRIKPDIVVLVTGDADFAHLALTIRREGIKVEVASVPQTLSSELRTSANSIIDLTDIFHSFEPLEPNEPSQPAASASGEKYEA